MSSARFESDEVTLRRRNPVEVALAVALGVLGPVASVVLAMTLGSRVLAVLAPLAVAAAVHRYRKNARAVERLGRFSIGPLGVFFDGRRLASSTGLACAGVIAAPGDAPIVRLRTQNGVFEIRVPDVAEARRLVDALAREEGVLHRLKLPSRVMSQPGQLARFGLYAVVLTAAFPMVGLAWHANRLTALALLAGALLATVALMAGLMADTVVELAAEGVRVRWLGRQRFLPYRTIESMRAVDEAADLSGTRTQPHLAITLKSGEVMRLPAGEVAPEALHELLRRARQALVQRKSPTETALERRGGGVRGWFQALRALATGAGPATHRTAPLASEVLWRVVEDQDAAAEARAGAAVALLSALGEDARPRVRIAALGAAPHLRVALEAAADATTEAELEQALAEVAEPESPRLTDGALPAPAVVGTGTPRTGSS